MPNFEYVSVQHVVAHQADRLGGRVAFTYEGRPCSYEHLHDRSSRVARWLVDAGVRRGDTVAMLMRNSAEFLHVWLGIAQSGAIAVPVNSAMVGEGLHYTLQHSGAVGLMADSDLWSQIQGLPPLPDLRWRVVVGPGPGTADSAVAFDELLSVPQLEATVHIDRLDPMSIIYTSGTTGLPKGVVLSHNSYLNTGRYFAKHFDITQDDVLHTCLPLFHCNAQQTTFMAGLLQGAPIALNGKFSLSRFWDWIHDSGATMTNLLGSMLALLAKREPSASDRVNTLRYMIAAPVQPAIHRALEERFEVRIVEGYGLSETGTMCCINPVNDTRIGTIGLPLDHNELRIVDETGEQVPDGVRGEIVTRSHVPGAYMTGYFKEPEQTAEAVRRGWFHTGDVGLRRDDGYFVFVDRLKDTIRRRGENISSVLVERGLAEHPDIIEAAAVGAPSELSEEDVKVVVIVRPGVTLDPREVIDWCAQRMSDFMVPRYVEFRAELPRTETGRVHKYVLRREGVGSAWDAQAETGLTTGRWQ